MSTPDAAIDLNIAATRRNAIVRAVERVAPAVVSVNVLEIRYERTIDPFMQDFFSFFDFPRAQTRIREWPVEGIGSGFIFDKRGYAMTNHHVIRDADFVSVTLPDGREFEVEFVGSDLRTDIAVLKINGAGNLPIAPLGDSDDLLIAEWVIALGNPFGMLVDDPQPSVSVGVISANHRRINPSVGKGQQFYQDMIQTDAAINPGNSGGPLVNGAGEVIGVNTFIFSNSGRSHGLGFAIPANRARRVAEELIQFGRRRDPWPGFSVAPTDQGMVVYEIMNDCPARLAGLDPCDRIVAVDDRAIEDPRDIDFAFWRHFVGDSVTLEVQGRNGTRTIRFPLEELR
ncbi:MAG: trypsin-like peptidase domain-containing protein [Candidatus Hydrogenedentales bacterium]